MTSAFPLWNFNIWVDTVLQHYIKSQNKESNYFKLLLYYLLSY